MSLACTSLRPSGRWCSASMRNRRCRHLTAPNRHCHSNAVALRRTGWGHRPLGVMVLALAYRTGAVWNESGYSNKDLDQLLTEAEGTLDVEKRRAVMAKIEAILQDDGPITQAFWRTTSTVMDKKVKGFKQHPSQYIFGNELAISA